MHLHTNLCPTTTTSLFLELHIFFAGGGAQGQLLVILADQFIQILFFFNLSIFLLSHFYMLGAAEAFLTSCVNLDKILKYKEFSGKRLALINKGTVCWFFLAIQ